ncbi:hypothetical protein THAOC_11365 [Thalassiosira oceanica]|uniref:Uncharacterized protein n=1 Tax=Thalassiosira oceanica TaxID=159749 RepID=K0SQD0_THAOC|nr:hypothetical protein THAOC_11365 [Thalassiosira oceanica]|eukprot:EJK67580.1 hypothetical protein THAOC_11365 [Thalassiosira oceanica]
MPNHFDFCPLCFDAGKELLGATDSQRAELEAYYRNKLRTKEDRIKNLERVLGRMRRELDERTTGAVGAGGDSPETREPPESAPGETVSEKTERPSETRQKVFSFYEPTWK